MIEHDEAEEIHSRPGSVSGHWPTDDHETYVPWFPPCQPCGHCPACGRGGMPVRWPYWQYVGDYPGYTFTTIGQSESNYTLYNVAVAA